MSYGLGGSRSATEGEILFSGRRAEAEKREDGIPRKIRFEQCPAKSERKTNVDRHMIQYASTRKFC